MNFTKSEILSMYGSQFFIVENETGETKAAETPLLEEAKEPIVETTPVEERVDAPLLGGVGGGSKKPVIKEPPIALASLEQKINKPDTTPAQPEVPVSPAAPISWKMRKTATVVLVMKGSEFKNKMMTMALKNCVEAAGVSTVAIGFGVMEGESSNWNFADMPVSTAVMFGKVENQKMPEGKTLHQVDTLTEIVLDPEKQNTLISLLQKIIK